MTQPRKAAASATKKKPPALSLATDEIGQAFMGWDAQAKESSASRIAAHTKKIATLAFQRKEAETALTSAVVVALAEGVGQEAVADALGVTRQAVSQRYSAVLAARLLADRRHAPKASATPPAASKSQPAPSKRQQPPAKTSTVRGPSRAAAKSPRTAKRGSK